MQTSGEQIFIARGCMPVKRGCEKRVKEMQILDARICTIQGGSLEKKGCEKRDPNSRRTELYHMVLITGQKEMREFGQRNAI